jgi:hypothetical protein
MAGGGGVGAEGTIVVAGGCTTICVVGGAEVSQAASPSVAGKISGSE